DPGRSEETTPAQTHTCPGSHSASPEHGYTQPQKVVGPPKLLLVYEAQRPFGRWVHSASVLQVICISENVHALIPSPSEQVTGSLRWMVPSGQREKPE